MVVSTSDWYENRKINRTISQWRKVRVEEEILKTQ